MTKFIFTFSILLTYFLTIVSCNVFGNPVPDNNLFTKIVTFSGNDTIASIFRDNFENNNFSGWKQTTDWEVSATEKISGTLSLKHLSNIASGKSFIFHPVTSDLGSSDIAWSFQLKNGNWDPSSSNRFWFYLTADTNCSDSINGWVTGVNISGNSDLLELWRIKNGKPDSLIVRSDLDWDASTLVTITVKRTVRGAWTLQYQKPGGIKSSAFSGNDRHVAAFKNIGLNFNFTSTRAGQLWIDDISVARLNSELFIQKLSLVSQNTITLTFNKPIDPASIRSGNFKLTDENNQIIPINQAILNKGSDTSIDVSFGKLSGAYLSLTISGISDRSGITMQPDTRSFSYSFRPEPGSVLINEVLFNPFSGGSDFVELVNVSEQTVPVHRLMLATRDDALALKQIYPVSAEKRYLKPGEFLVCTKNPTILASQYFTCNPASFCLMKSFPSYSDDAGTVALLNDSLEVLDEFNYSAKMHSPFLSEEEGVSLERISSEKPTNDRANWASATASAGFATPGLPNSQTENDTNTQEEITCEPKAFSPNGDGYNDELSIKFGLGKPGYIANVRIFDAAGRLVKFLVKNQSLSQEGIWLWDGKSESGQKLSIGVYIILVEIFDQNGHTKAFKETCTLTDRLE
jgi:hypothetical protein